MRYTTFVSLVASLVMLSREYTASPCGWVDSGLGTDSILIGTRIARY